MKRQCSHTYSDSRAEQEQFYILVGEKTVREYKADITEVIEPQIKELIERSEKGLRLLERREHSLQAKVPSTSRF
jgi:DASH complex subunit SPC19